MTLTDDPMEEIHDEVREDRDEAQEKHETQQTEETQTQEHDEAQTAEQDAPVDSTSDSAKRPSDDVETADAPAPAQSEESQPQEETDAPPAKRRALCGVCDTEAAKYKCSRCRLGYCSLACSRKHQENHPPDEPKEVKLDVQPETEKTPAKPAHPFQVLDDAPELQRLFKEYPRLPARLRSIHDATLPPRNGGANRGRGRGRGGFAKTQPWTKEIGLLQGQKALRRARVDPTEDGDAVRAYCEVVTYLLGKGAAEAAASASASANATAIVRAELAAEGTQVIQQLLDAEGRQ